MMRVTPEQLREYVQARPTDTLTTYINDANLLVNETLLDKGLTEARLQLIEKALAAHLYALARERGSITEEKVGEASTRYAAFSGFGLRATVYGQFALGLDESGTLESLSADKKRAVFRVM